jgi:thiamine biosynthesis lipoprotein
LAEALACCAFFEKLLSRFVEGSDVWRLNHAQGKPVEVSGHTITILRLAEEVRAASRGAFNIAVGEASTLWDFSAVSPRPPAPDELEAAARRLASVRIDISLDASSVALRGGEKGSADGAAGSTGGARGGARGSAGIQVDLGGIAKGYICDQVADFLRSRGVTSGLLNFGGNVVAIGQHPEGRPWSVALQRPDALRDTAGFAVVACEDGAGVTSGIYERGVEWEGHRYHHVLDPRSCWPVDTGLLSVSVLASDAMLADALATAILVLGTEDGFALASRYHAQLVLLNDEQRIHYSKDTPLKLLNTTQDMTVALPLE